MDVFRSVAKKLNIPIVTYWNAVDLIEDDNPLYCGRAGNMGDRPESGLYRILTLY